MWNATGTLLLFEEINDYRILNGTCALFRERQHAYFDGTTLICPSLMFTVILYIKHALGDFLHGHLTLKEIVDWVVLRRKQGFDKEVLNSRCKEFKFDRFLELIDALADVVEGKIEYKTLSPAYREAFDDVFLIQGASKSRSWFRRRVDLFFDIVKNERMERSLGTMVICQCRRSFSTLYGRISLIRR